MGIAGIDTVIENCVVENFDDVVAVKPNPGNVGSGIIDRITYRNIEIESALWYPLWFGPQQQHQPHQTGTGCSFFYPIDPECPPQPLVPMTNFVVENVIASETLLMPGVILCSSKNPCTGFQFTNVTITGPFDVQSD